MPSDTFVPLQFNQLHIRSKLSCKFGIITLRKHAEAYYNPNNFIENVSRCMVKESLSYVEVLLPSSAFQLMKTLESYSFKKRETGVYQLNLDDHAFQSVPLDTQRFRVTLKHIGRSDMENIRFLLHTLSGKEYFIEYSATQKRILDVDTIFIGIYDTEKPEMPLVAMTTLIFVEEIAFIEDVVRHPDYKGCGLGSMVMHVAYRYASIDASLSKILLTSGPNKNREQARKLYKKLGYKKIDLIPFRLTNPNL